MTEQELDALVEAELSAALAAEKVRLRAVIRDRLQREENRRWYDAIDQRWREREARERAAEPERRRIMAEGVRRDMESMDRSNAKPTGSLAATRAADRAGGRSGFTIK